ncbi:MAG TPA: hypothetical protein VGJ83_05900 [Gemmatimonadales bacterium]|jgi:uncharacterized protein YcfJ
MSRIGQLSLILPLALVSAVPAQAQRVRLWAPKPTIGTLIRSDSAAFVLVAANGRDTVTLPRLAVQRAEVSRGRHGATLEGAVIGGVAGGVIGGLVGAASYRKPTCDPQADLVCLDMSFVSVAVGAVVGVVGGGVLGAAIGSQTQVERWTPSPRLTGLRVTAARRSVGLQVGVRW